MDEKTFGKRLSDLREKRNVSARDMSLSLGQSAGYINNIENGKNYPSMTVFFYICEYLNITPSGFFETECHNPSALSALIGDLKSLKEPQLRNIIAIVRDIRASNP